MRVLDTIKASEVTCRKRMAWLLVFGAVAVMPCVVGAQDAVEVPKVEGSDPAVGGDVHSAPMAVRAGNVLLTDGDASAALESYDRASELAPGAKEIDFDRGLAHYSLKEFDKARDSFLEAGTSDDPSLVSDALYSLGTCDHSEALNSTDEPEHAIELLESAIRQYRQVLSGDGEHAAARDANRKAAAMRRQLKQMLEQQQEQQQSDKNDKDEEQEDQKEGEKEQSEEKSEDEQQSSDQSKQDEQEDQESKEQSSSDESEQDKQEQSQNSAEQSEQQVSREQAERQLREMMQALRDRMKLRRKPMQRIPVKPVDKDW